MRHAPLVPRPLHVIATEIRRNWGKVNYRAKPYLSAMGTLNLMSDMYGVDNARYIVAYFLGNASTWRGEVARRVKLELKEMLANDDRSKGEGLYATLRY